MKLFYILLAILEFNFSYSVIRPLQIEQNIGSGGGEYFEQTKVENCSQLSKEYHNWPLPFYFRVKKGDQYMWFEVINVVQPPLSVRVDIQTKQWVASKDKWIGLKYMSHCDEVYPPSSLDVFHLQSPLEHVKGHTGHYKSENTSIHFGDIVFFVKAIML